MSNPPRPFQRGVALLETLIALAILSVAGLSVVALVDSLIRTQSEATRREETLTTAGRVLGAATLLKKEELDQRLGTRETGEFFLDVQRPESSLYRIAIGESSAPTLELLVTVIYRP
jgi:type II secretory pathway component PulJ